MSDTSSQSRSRPGTLLSVMGAIFVLGAVLTSCSHRSVSRQLIENGHLDAADGNDWGASFTVILPPVETLVGETGVGKIKVHTKVNQIEISSGVGDLELSGSFAHVAAKSGVGDIDLKASTLGGADLSSGTGNVSLEAMEGPTDNATVKTGVGNVSCLVSAAYDGKVDLSTGVGSLKVANAPAVVSKDSVVGGSASGALGQGTQVVRATTGTGNVSFRRSSE